MVTRGKFLIDKIESSKDNLKNKLQRKTKVMESQKQELEEKA